MPDLHECMLISVGQLILWEWETDLQAVICSSVISDIRSKHGEHIKEDKRHSLVFPYCDISNPVARKKCCHCMFLQTTDTLYVDVYASGQSE